MAGRVGMLQGTSQAAGKPDLLFDPLDPCPAEAGAELVASVLLVAKQVRALLNLKLTELGLVAGQEQLLLALGPGETLVICDIAEALTVRPSTVSKMVDRLSEKGFVARLHDPDDARRILVRLTQGGIDMRQSVRAVMIQFEAELLRGLGDRAGTTRAGTYDLEQVLAARLRRLR